MCIDKNKSTLGFNQNLAKVLYKKENQNIIHGVCSHDHEFTKDVDRGGGAIEKPDSRLG
jgi:hypothetical protein